MKALVRVLVIMLLIAGCAETEGPGDDMAAEEGAAPDEICPSVVGTWELVSIKETASALSGEFDSDPDYQEAPTLKVLNETHWMFIRQAADIFVHAQGGRYSLERGGFYTEMVEYSAIPQNVGESFSFECTIEGDSLWYHTGGQGDNRYDEIWRRVH